MPFFREYLACEAVFLLVNMKTMIAKQCVESYLQLLLDNINYVIQTI